VLALVAVAGEGPGGGALEAVRAFGGPELEHRVAELIPLVRAQPADSLLPMLEVALPALQRLPPAEAQRLRDGVEMLVRSDGRVRPFEYALMHTLGRRLQIPGGGVDRARGQGIRSLDAARDEVEVLLSAVAWAGGGEDEAAAERALRAGAQRLPSLSAPLRLLDPSGVGLDAVEAALTRLEHASLGVRRLVLEACAEAAARDGHLRRREAELLRAISESLDCPIPPLLPEVPDA
jgi:hypothetical protein